MYLDPEQLHRRKQYIEGIEKTLHILVKTNVKSLYDCAHRVDWIGAC